MTIKAVTPRVVEPPASLGMGVSVYPSATAMVWQGEGHPHEAVAVPGVRLAPGDALVAIELATVCGSDVHTVLGHRSAPTPLVLGHEQVGRVIALGRGGAKTTDGRRVSIGERVVWSVAVPCGRCARCRRGLPQKCLNLQKYGHERMRRGWELSGGFATHTHILDGTPMVAVPDDLPAEILAPASCSTATVAAALEAASAIVPLDGALVLIAGAGMLGLTAAAMATEAGARVVVTDPVPERRQA
ncbi:alcohol dehydrogenase catalytic domain-containing protein, partial [uncultured Leifsonia sp.]|uniref:alcohol dehydrogenase catalytic domain-containing protein n=1 Tax=uncultured Leifsonia sp. TaxID=340359 RepID=UPI0028D2B823